MNIRPPLFCLAVFLCLSTTSKGTQVHPDLRVGVNALGVVAAVSDQGVLTIRRTNNGPKDGSCSVLLEGVVFPKDKAIKKQAVAWLRKRFVNREVRFIIQRRDDKRFWAYVLATDLKPDAAANSYLVSLGLADTDKPDERSFALALRHAKENKLGIWADK